MARCRNCGQGLPRLAGPSPAASADHGTQAGTDRPTPAPGKQPTLRVVCSCGQTLRVGLAARGKKVKCPKCSSAVAVPAGDTDSKLESPSKISQPVKAAASIERPSAVAQRSGATNPARASSTTTKTPSLAASKRIRDDEDDEPNTLKEEIERACQLPVPEAAESAPPRKLSGGKLRKLRQALEITNILSDSEARTRREALLELGQSQDPRVLNDLLASAEDPTTGVREAMVNALGSLGVPEGVPAVLTALLDRESVVVRAAFSALKKIGDHRVVRPLLLVCLERPEFKPLSNDTLVRLGEKIVQDLLSVMLQASDPGMTLETIVVLGRIGDKQAVPALIKCLDHVSTLLKAHVIEALALIGDSRAVPQMLRALEDPMTAVRVNAAAGLVRMPDPKNLHPLLRAMQDEDSDVRRFAAVAIGELSDSQAVPHLLPVLEAWEPLIEADPDLLEAVVETIGKLGDPLAVPSLIPLLRAKHDGILLKAVIALKRLRDPAAVPALLDLVRSPKATLRRRVIETLGQSGDVSVVPTLAERLREDSAPDVRAAAARALGELKAADAVPALEEALRDEMSVRIQVVIALGNVRHKHSLAALMAMLKDGAAEVRYHALNAIGKYQEPKSMKAVASMLQDSEPMVKAAAEKVLELFGDAVKEDQAVKTIVNKARSRDLVRRLIPSWIYLLVPTSNAARTIVAGIAACIVMMPLLIRVAVGGPSRVTVRGNVQALAISADGNTVAAERTLGLLEVWDVQSQKLLTNAQGEGLRAPTIRPNGEAVLLQAEAIVPWTMKSKPNLEQAWSQHKQPITKFAVSSNGKFAISMSRDLMTVIWDLDAGRKASELEFTERFADALSISNDGQFVAAANVRGEATVFEVASGKQIKQLVSKADGPGLPIVATTLSPDGKWLAGADQTGGLRLWNLSIDELMAKSVAVKTPMKVVGWRFLSDSQRVLSIDSGGGVSAWHVEKEEPQSLFAAELEQIDGFALDANEKRLALGCATSSGIMIYDLESGELFKKLDVKSR